MNDRSQPREEQGAEPVRAGTRRSPAEMTTHRLYLARCAFGALSLLLLILAVGLRTTGNPDRAFSDLVLVAFPLMGAISCTLAAWSASGRLRIAWGGLGMACLSWSIGEAVFSWYELVLHHELPFPGWADVGFLGFPLGAVVALAVFPSNVSHADRRRMTLDGLMIASAIGLVSWETALGAVVDAGGESLLPTAVSVAYPVTDIVLLVVCVLVLSRSRAHRVPLGLVAVGLMLMSVADSGYAYLVAAGTYTAGHPIDIGWMLAFVVIALATLAPGATSTTTEAETIVAGGTFLPYVPLGAAAGFMGWQVATGRPLSIEEAVLAVGIGLLVLLRQFLTVRDNGLLAIALAEREAELRHQAFHDQLTGLANRALFVDRVAHALELHRRDRRQLAICFLDLDGFKAVNDKLGHSAGDDLLQEASVRFHEVLSDADTLSRFGGDEFAVLLEGQADPVEAARALLKSLSPPFNLGDRQMSVLASIGVALVEPGDPTPSVDELLVRADLAMYVVKRRGKAGVLLHTEGLQLEEVDDVVLGRALARALVEKQLTLAFQPVVDLPTGRLDTLEALARWAPGGRPMSPRVFVRIAEQCDLLEPLFQFVLAEACRQLVRWTALPAGSDVRVALNITPSQLSSPELPQFVATELSRHGLTGDRLVLEITDTGGLMSTETSHVVCHELRRLGVRLGGRLSVDDFGTGLSSLARLRDLPINEVKIDRSFIADVDQDGARRRFVWGVLAFAERVGLTVVAEGVEQEAERDALADLGCHRAQGFLFSRPVPAESVDALLDSPERWRRRIPTPWDATPVLAEAALDSTRSAGLPTLGTA